MARKWHAKSWKMKRKDEHWQGAMAGIADPGEYADEILPNGNYSSLFVYMFRRFGIPEWGSDPYKEIACWFITTPDPAVVLIVSPRPSGLRYSFGYEINTSVYGYQSHDDVEAIRSKIEPSLKEAMKDLELISPADHRRQTMFCSHCEIKKENKSLRQQIKVLTNQLKEQNLKEWGIG